MANVSVPIEFIASFDEALKGVSDFANHANKKLGAIGSGVGIIAFNAALEIAEKVFEVFEKVAEAIADVVKEAADAQDGINRMGLALKAVGDYSEQNVEAFENLADELSRTTRFSDEQIISQVALAKQFNTTNREAAKLIEAATELAAATGEDLGTAVAQLGMTLEGTAGRVGKMIPSIKQLSREQLLAGDAIDVVAKRFKGFSEGELLTFNGALGQSKKAFSEVLKALVTPIVKDKGILLIFQTLTNSLYDLVDVIKENQGSIADFVKNSIVFAVEGFALLSIGTGLAYRQFAILKAQVLATAGGLDALAELAKGQVSEAMETLRGVAKDYGKDMDDIGKNSVAFDKVTNAAAALAVKIDLIDTNTKKVKRSTKDAADGFDSATNSAKRFDTEIIAKVKQLQEELKNVGADKIQTLTNQYNYQISLIDQAAAHDQNVAKASANLKQKLLLKYNNELFDAINTKVQSIFQNPFNAFQGDNKSPFGSLGVSASTQNGIAAGAGAANDVLQGAAGASNLLSAGISAAGTALLGPVGGVLGPIAAQLAKGPEAVKQMVDDFTSALPALIINLVKAIPVFTSEFVRQIPTIINGLIDGLPDIIQALVLQVPDLIAAIIADIPQIIFAIVAKLPGALATALGRLFTGAGAQFVGKILDGAVQFIGKILEGAGQFIQKLVEGITGGAGGFVGDLVGGIGDLVGGVGDVVGGLFREQDGVRSATQSPQVARQAREQGPTHLEIPVSIGHAQFARAIVDVGRLGYRLVPV